MKLFIENNRAESILQLLDPVSSISADWHNLDFFITRFELLQAFGGAGQIHFVSRDYPRAFAQRRIVEIELAPEIFQISDRLAPAP